MIRFETFQLVTFVLTSSLFLYMVNSLILFIIKQVRPKKVGPLARGSY